MPFCLHRENYKIEDIHSKKMVSGSFLGRQMFLDDHPEPSLVKMNDHALQE